MKVAVTGHRPSRIGGYQTPNPTEQWVRGIIRGVLERLKRRHPDLVGISGMAIGTDQIFAEECVSLDIPFVAAIPFRGQEGRWPPDVQERYRELLGKAAEVVTVDEQDGYVARDHRAKFLLRNRWMVDRADLLLAVWNGSKGGTAHTVGLAEKAGVRTLRADPSAKTVTEWGRISWEPDALEMFGADPEEA